MLSKVALIGAGNMGGAMLRGWLESGVLQPREVLLSDCDAAKVAALGADHGVATADGNRSAASGARMVFLAVKPQDAASVLDEIGGAVGQDQALVSIAAGVSIASLRERIGAEPSLVRVMPNMGAQVGAAVSAYSMDPGPRGFDFAEVVRLLEAFGEAIEVPEEQMDLVTAISGSGPAYFFLMVEALEEAGKARGMDALVARLLARETLWGAAKVLKMTGKEASGLREAVSSPGGTTLAALGEMGGSGFREMMDRAVEAACQRAGELSS